MVRMARDFPPISLPERDGSSLNINQAKKVQQATWNEILTSLDDVQLHCVNKKMAGWTQIQGGIIAAYWPVGSQMDMKYGLDVRGEKGPPRRMLNQANGTEVIG